MKTSVKVDLSACVLARITVDVEVETGAEGDWQPERTAIERAAKANALGLAYDLSAWRLETPVESIGADDLFTTEADRLSATWRQRNGTEQPGDA